jgi:hypothetical protein
MGPATRNPDGIVHNMVDVLQTTPTYIANVGFEDLHLTELPDFDYDDNVFQFTGSIIAGGGAVPVPPTVVCVATGVVGLLGARIRRRSAGRSE